MSLPLQSPIAAYFAAEADDNETLVQLFTPDAVVKDEGATHVGHPAIRAWKAESHRQYTFKAEPLTAQTQGDTTTVVSRVTGNFPGSPVELEFNFRLSDGRIASLEIG
jgi:hypothetical protein